MASAGGGGPVNLVLLGRTSTNTDAIFPRCTGGPYDRNRTPYAPHTRAPHRRHHRYFWLLPADGLLAIGMVLVQRTVGISRDDHRHLRDPGCLLAHCLS